MRKRRLPRGVRIRRCGQGFRSRSSFSGAHRPEMLGIMAGMYSKDISTLLVVYGSGAYDMLVWLVPMHLALCFLLTSLGPGCSASWPMWTRRTVLFVRSSSTLAVACAQLVLLVTLLLALFPSLSSGPDACPHGRYGPEGMLRVAVQTTADFPQLQFLAGRRYFLSWCGGRFPWSCLSADRRNSPVAPVHVVDAAGLQIVLIFHVVAQAVSHGPDLFRTKVFPQLLDMVIDVPVAQVVQFVIFVVSQRRVPMVQAQLIDKVFEVPVCRSSSFLGCTL